MGRTNIKGCKTTFTESFPQIWPLSCIFPLLTGVGCLPLTLKKNLHEKKPGCRKKWLTLCGTIPKEDFGNIARKEENVGCAGTEFVWTITSIVIRDRNE